MVEDGYVLILMFYSIIVWGWGDRIVGSERKSITSWQRFIGIILLTSAFITSITIAFDGIFHLFSGYSTPLEDADFTQCRGRSCLLLVPIMFIFSEYTYPWFALIFFGGFAWLSFSAVKEQIMFLTNGRK